MSYFLSKFLIFVFFIFNLNNKVECSCLQMTNGVPSYSNGPDCVQISNGGNSQGESIFPQNVGNKKSQQNGCSSACVGAMCVKTCN
uniref:Uncharacterized protein n=1 Tax=Meloidogyne enterolobii TaxID=390850 RepID=A0A6V7UVT9_MELEN|nr:unnamed protein product [Meloidogyne enterolobii]